jgi:D-alanyl-D-alanine carboxypeptidase
VNNLVPVDASPPNLRDEMCGGKHRPASDEDEDTIASGTSGTGETALSFFAAGLQQPTLKPSELMALPAAPSEPIPVYTGPTKTGAALIAAVAADSDKQTAHPKAKKARVAAKKLDNLAEVKTEAKDSGKNTKDAGKSAKSETPAKPSTVRHANAKPDAPPKSADKAAANASPPAAKPAKPKTVAKPPAKPSPKSTTSDAKPAG